MGYLPIAALWRDLGMKANALDVIRHEFGHALADLYPGALKKGGLFRAAFGGTYCEDPAEECVAAVWGDRYVSEYATSATPAADERREASRRTSAREGLVVCGVCGACGTAKRS